MADNNPIQDQERSQSFVTWSDESGKQQALLDTADNIDSYDGVQKSTSNRRSFLDIESNISVRTGFNRGDYDRFRSSESVPKQQKEAIIYQQLTGKAAKTIAEKEKAAEEERKKKAKVKKSPIDKLNDMNF